MAPRNKALTELTDAQMDEDKAGTAIKTRRIIKKKDFTDRAVERSGVAKADAKRAVDATLSVLAEALANGDELVVPPFGKLKVTREKAHPKGRILMLRLQLTPEAPSGTEPLAE